MSTLGQTAWEAVVALSRALQRKPGGAGDRDRREGNPLARLDMRAEELDEGRLGRASRTTSRPASISRAIVPTVTLTALWADGPGWSPLFARRSKPSG
jgi:hypothetical protein